MALGDKALRADFVGAGDDHGARHSTSLNVFIDSKFEHRLPFRGLRRLDRCLAILQRHPSNSAIMPAAFQLHLEAEQTPVFV